MYFTDHSFRIWKVLVEKLHCIPQIVTTPVLPVLNNTIYRDTCLPVSPNNAGSLILRLVSLLALKVTVSPQREERYIASQMTHLCNNTIGIFPVHQIIIHTVPNL